jgi:hypothetical protein
VSMGIGRGRRDRSATTAQHDYCMRDGTLERYADACGYVVGFVVGAAELAVVIDIGGNAVAPLHREAGPEEQAVAADSRATNGKATACTVRETGDNRVSAVAIFVLPGGAQFRSYEDIANFPIVGGFHSECGAYGVHVLVIEFQGRKRAALGKATVGKRQCQWSCSWSWFLAWASPMPNFVGRDQDSLTSSI